MSRKRFPNDREFAQLLCVRAASIMEDICGEAVLAIPAGPDEQSNRVTRLSDMADDAALLLRAAEIWLRTEAYQ